MATNRFTMLIDDNDISQFGMKLMSYEKSSYIKRKTSGVDIPGAHGTQAVPSALASNDFFAQVVCSGKNPNDVHRKIREFLAYMYSTGDAHKIVFSDDADIVRNAILDTPDKYKVIDGVDGAFAQLKLSFLMLDPFSYETATDRLIFEAVHGEEFLISNEAFECPARFTIKNTGNVVLEDISLVVNDEIANFRCTVNPNSELLLDTIEYEVRIDGASNLACWSGEMPLLKNGHNRITVTNDKHMNMTVIVEFTRQWI